MKGKIFTTQEVQALLNGSKVMFREVIKPQIIKLTDQENKHLGLVDGYTFGNEIWADLGKCKKTAIFRCPYKVGQKIFCKESFAEVEVGAGMGYNSGKQTLYKAVDDYDVKWKPAQHMKQEHSRLTLLIKEIKVEKLTDITPFDCVCEGVWDGRNVALGMSGKAVEAFKDNWNATHKKPEEKFEANPWVWCVNFEVINN